MASQMDESKIMNHFRTLNSHKSVCTGEIPKLLKKSKREKKEAVVHLLMHRVIKSSQFQIHESFTLANPIIFGILQKWK